MKYLIIEHVGIDCFDYERVLIVNKSIPFEIVLFNYMSQLEVIDEHACAFISKFGNTIIISSHRMNAYDITISDDALDSFSQYTLVNGDVEKHYESLFDIDIPCKKTIFLTKHDHELVLKVV